MRIIRDRRGVVALEFVLVALPFLIMLFGIIEVGRYAVTVYSLRTLASATARSLVMNCYSDKMSQNQSPSVCTSDSILTDTTSQQDIAPFLFVGGDHPTVTINADTTANTLTVTACFPAPCSTYSLVIPLITAVPAPSVSVVLPF